MRNEWRDFSASERVRRIECAEAAIFTFKPEIVAVTGIIHGPSKGPIAPFETRPCGTNELRLTDQALEVIDWCAIKQLGLAVRDVSGFPFDQKTTPIKFGVITSCEIDPAQKRRWDVAIARINVGDLTKVGSSHIQLTCEQITEAWLRTEVSISVTRADNASGKTANLVFNFNFEARNSQRQIRTCGSEDDTNSSCSRVFRLKLEATPG